MAQVGAGDQPGDLAFQFSFRQRGLRVRAAGGPVSARQAYLVGERGPEIIVPRGAGEVIPNHKLGDGPANVTFAPSITIGTTDDRTAAQIEAALSREQARFFARWQRAQKEHAQRFA